MNWELVLSTAPTQEPVSLQEAKDHLRVDGDQDNAIIEALIMGARDVVEQVNGRSLFTTTWKLILDEWPCRDYINLPRPPLQSVTSVVYTDKDDVETTWDSSNYEVETLRVPGRIHLVYGGSWPTATLRPASPIEITYVSGWTTVEAIPVVYKQAIKLLLGHWYENREGVVVSGAVPKETPLGFESLVLLDRVGRVQP